MDMFPHTKGLSNRPLILFAFCNLISLVYITCSLISTSAELHVPFPEIQVFWCSFLAILTSYSSSSGRSSSTK